MVKLWPIVLFMTGIQGWVLSLPRFFLAAAIVEDVRGFREQAALDDDMTFPAVKITGLQY